MNCSKFCVIAFLLLILCYLIVLLSFFALEIHLFRNLRALQLNYTSIQIDGFSNSLLKSYKLVTLDPINFIYAIPSNSSSCEHNDEIVTFYSKKTVTVCLCPYTSNFSAGECSSSEIKNCYTSFETILEFQNWKGVKFCISRLKNYYKKERDAECDSGYLSCSNNICVKISKNESADYCPITGLTVFNDSNYHLNYVFVSKFNDGSNLFVTKNIRKSVIVDLQVEINDFPCIYSYEAPNRSEYVLLKSEPNGCQAYGQDKEIYSEIAWQNESDMYFQNNAIEISKDLNNRSLSNNSAKLFAVGNPSTKCISNYILTLNDPALQSLENLRYGGDGIGSILTVFFLILFFVHIYGMYSTKNITDSITLAFSMILMVFIQEIVCPVSLSYLGMSIKNNQYLFDMNVNKCFENSGYNRMISDFFNFVFVDTRKIFGIVFTILYFSLVIFLCVILYLVDKIKFNYFFEEERNGILEETDFLENCKINVKDVECDCLM